MSLTVAALLHAATLPDSDSARLDAELLLAHALNKPRSFLLTWPEHQPQPAETEQFQQMLARRRQGEPVAYLLAGVDSGVWIWKSTVLP